MEAGGELDRIAIVSQAGHWTLAGLPEGRAECETRLATSPDSPSPVSVHWPLDRITGRRAPA